MLNYLKLRRKLAGSRVEEEAQSVQSEQPQQAVRVVNNGEPCFVTKFSPLARMTFPTYDRNGVLNQFRCDLIHTPVNFSPEKCPPDCTSKICVDLEFKNNQWKVRFELIWYKDQLNIDQAAAQLNNVLGCPRLKQQGTLDSTQLIRSCWDWKTLPYDDLVNLFKELNSFATKEPNQDKFISIDWLASIRELLENTNADPNWQIQLYQSRAKKCKN